jgi:LuxR family maltose regulon positive regulatory protein
MQAGTGLIATRLKMPSPRRNHLRREALFAKLDGVKDHLVTLVRGAAGSGKTTLLTSYIACRAGMPFKWLSLDEDLGDGLAFWRYFAAALSGGGAGGGVAALVGAAMGREELLGLMPALIEEMGGMGEFALVLDDFHLLRDEALLSEFDDFLKNCPENAHFVLLTREEPPLYLGDLAVAGALLEIGEEDLRFSDAEALEFLTGTLNLSMDEVALGAIREQAEGWAGGLQLMALAASGGAARGLRPMGRYAVEYLQREILDSLSPTLQDFMVKTSALKSFDAGIADELFHASDSAEIIRTLQERNLFVIAIGDEGRAFRYHHIFNDFLSLRFKALEAAERDAFHRSAARCYDRRGRYEEALRQYLKADAYPEAMALLKRESADYRLWSLLGEIPLEVLKTDRDLVILRLFHLYYNAGPEALTAFLDAFREEMARDEWRSLKIAKSVMIDFDFQADAMTAEEIEAIDVGPVARAVLFVKTGAFLYMKYELRGSLLMLDRAEAALKGHRNPFIEMSVWSIKSSDKEVLGDFAECETLYGKIFALIRESGLMTQLAFNFHIGETGIHLKTGRLEKAQAALEDAKRATRGTDLSADVGYLHNLMELKLLEGDADAARGLIEAMLRLSYFQDMLAASTLVKYLALTERLTEELAGRYEAAYLACEPRFLRIEDRLAFSRVLHFRDRDAEALEMLDGLLETLRKQKILVKLVEALVFKRALLARAGHLRQAADALREAVYYGCLSRILSPFLMEGPELAKPLTQLTAERGADLTGGEKLFIGELVARLKPAHAEGVLSERELEVLKQLATGASNKEIGERLFISLSTVKTHVINIYAKLEAAGRVEAVEKARGMGLID